MTYEGEKGTFIKKYQPDNRSTRFFRIWLTMMPVEFLALIIFVVVMMFLLFGYDWPLFVFFMVGLLVVMEFVTYPIADKVASGNFRPTFLYTNGVEGYRSFYYRLKGIEPFLRKEDIIEIQVKSIYLESTIEAGQVKLEEIESANMHVNVLLRNGKSRVVALASPREAQELAEFMGRTWSIPVRSRIREYQYMFSTSS